MGSFWRNIKRVKIKDFEFQNVPPSTAYTIFLFGLIHFMIIGTAFLDLKTIEQYNWGIFKSLGLADSFQLPLMLGLLVFDAFLMIYGVYLLKHVAPEADDLPDPADDKYSHNKEE